MFIEELSLDSFYIFQLDLGFFFQLNVFDYLIDLS